MRATASLASLALVLALPVAGQDRPYIVPTEHHRAWLDLTLDRHDGDLDGRLSRREIGPALPDHHFEVADRNGDGHLDREELLDMSMRLAPGPDGVMPDVPKFVIPLFR